MEICNNFLVSHSLNNIKCSASPYQINVAILENTHANITAPPLQKKKKKKQDHTTPATPPPSPVESKAIIIHDTNLHNKTTPTLPHPQPH